MTVGKDELGSIAEETDSIRDSFVATIQAYNASREAALVTFLVTASGLTLAGVGAAFWGLVAGVLALVVQRWRLRA